jgi:hypothetical protein
MNQKTQTLRDGENAACLLEQEKKYMMPLKPKFKASRQVICRVDKYATIRIDQNRYSVPDHLVGKQITATIYATHIRCYDNGEWIAEHVRCFGVHQWNLDITHYLTTLKKKPGALATSSALHQAQQHIKKIYHTYYSTASRDFVDLMIWIKEESIEFPIIEEIIDSLHRIHQQHVTTDKIKISYARLMEQPIQNEEVTEQSKEITQLAMNHLQAYGAMLSVG